VVETPALSKVDAALRADVSEVLCHPPRSHDDLVRAEEAMVRRQREPPAHLLSSLARLRAGGTSPAPRLGSATLAEGSFGLVGAHG
jgi:hypothetical protein